jgi:outer membrane lipoprotein-sorting protein
MRRGRGVREGIHWAAALTVLFSFGAFAAADEKVDDAINKLEERFAKIKSYVAKSKTMTDVEFGPGHTQKTEMLATTEWLRKGEQALMRADVKSKTATTEAGKTTQTGSTITAVLDADFSYTLNEEAGQKTVYKTKNQASSARDYHPKTLFEQWRAHHDVKLLPDEKVDGEDCYVFELTPKPIEGQPQGSRSVVWWQKDTALQVKSEAFDANGKLMNSSITTDLKINVDISEDRFKFEIPKDAQVFDMTQPQGQQPQAQPEEAEKEPPPKEEPKKPEKKKKKGILPDLPELP